MFVLSGGDLRPAQLRDVEEGESLGEVVEGPLLEDEPGQARLGDGVKQPEGEGVRAVSRLLADSQLVNLRKSKMITLILRLSDIPWMFILVQSDILSSIIPS